MYCEALTNDIHFVFVILQIKVTKKNIRIIQ